MFKEEKKELPLVVICGRANVGKSTLFNCLTEKKQALISNIAGTTRDSNIGRVEWNNSSFELIDTAGITETYYSKNKASDLDLQVEKQALSYLDKADLIVFLVDAKAGLMTEDKNLFKEIQKNNDYKEKMVLVANKVDSFKLAPETAVFNKLGLGEPKIISSVSGLGTGDLLDFIVDEIDKERIHKVEKESLENTKDEVVKVCLVGKPNAGKSSLLNSIVGYERVIVSPIAHTTRESQDTNINFKGNKLKIIDTAGISKQGKRSKGLERFGIERTLSTLKRSDIALMVLDLSEEITNQDLKIIEEINNLQKSLIIIANKWDKIEDRNTKEWLQAIRIKIPFVNYAPIQFISAKTGEKVGKIMDLIVTVAEQRKLSLSDSQTEKFLKNVVKIHKPAKGKGTKAPRIYEFKQLKSNPPLFYLRIGPNDNLHFSYVRFMENRLRDRHGFLGTPIKIKVAKHKKSHTTYNE